jgi:tetratricopeptide (TPR) repeat protein
MNRRGLRRGVTLGLLLGLGGAVAAAIPPRQEGAAGDAAAQGWARAGELRRAGDLEGAAASALTALASAPAVPALPEQRLAFDLAQELLRRGQGERAAELQAALHGRVRAEWSALDLSLTLGNQGQLERAAQVLADQLTLDPDNGELWNARAHLDLAAGELRAARRHLARAMLCGSENAALGLGRLSALYGSEEAARAAFRPGVDWDPPHDWALRGWAATLLPPATAP